MHDYLSHWIESVSSLIVNVTHFDYEHRKKNKHKITMSDCLKNKRLKQTFLSFTRAKTAFQIPIHQALVLPKQSAKRPFHVFHLSTEWNTWKRLRPFTVSLSEVVAWAWVVVEAYAIVCDTHELWPNDLDDRVRFRHAPVTVGLTIETMC